MKANNMVCAVRFILMSVVILLISGCTHIYDKPIELSMDYAQKNKINLKVELLLPDELCNAKWERTGGGDTWRIPLGNNFCKYTENFARTLFSDVIMTHSVHRTQDIGIDAVLTARMLSVIRTAWKTTVIYQWKLEDEKGGLVWIKAITAQGEDKPNNIDEQVQKLFDDLYKQSYKEMTSSVEIRKFVENSKKSVMTIAPNS